MIALPLLLAIASSAAQPPAQDAVVDEFIRSLPPSRKKRSGIDPDEEVKLSDLISRHPGQSDAISVAFAAQAHCAARAGDTAVDKALRQSAKALGDEKLRKLMQFYSSADAKRFAVLSEKKGASGTLSPSERAEFDRISSAYPLADFVAASKAAQSNMFSDGELWTALSACEEERDRALAKAGIRQSPR